MKSMYYLFAILLLVGCKGAKEKTDNPFIVNLNQPVDYSSVTSEDITEYSEITINESKESLETIKESEATFENVFIPLDDIFNNINTASNNCFMLYWVSPDSLSRINGLEAYQKLTSLSTSIYSNEAVFNKMLAVNNSEEYSKLPAHRQKLVEDLILDFKRSGVNLEDEQLTKFKKLTEDISSLSAEYSDNMNSASEVITLDEAGAKGLSENFKNTYRVSENNYEIPVMNATNHPVMENADCESTRKDYYMKFNNRAADKNLAILDQLVENRYELANIMGYESYAAYNLATKMAKNPETVWSFLNDLVDRSKEKAISDLEILKELKKNDSAAEDKELHDWDISYYNNQILKTEYQVDHEKLREYLPMKQCLEGVLNVYQQLLGLEFRKVENPPVWHPEVDMYEVFENGNLIGRFYLDLFPRPNKESWFYGVGITTGKLTADGYEVPSSMLLGNFTRATDDLPSLLSFKELNTLFHEFGHIMDAMSYKGEFSLQSSAKSDFLEAMSQIFENWTMDYETISKFAKHYKTGEVLPKELFDNMVKAKNVSSGYHTLSSLRKCIYDMNLYDSYNPENPVNTDDIWRNIDKDLGIEGTYVEGTHPQASWIHINTHPVYYYGYLWSEVYAQDMFTIFQQNGLTDQETGIRFRELILANDNLKDVMENVEIFLGRPSNNEAYIKSLGLE